MVEESCVWITAAYLLASALAVILADRSSARQRRLAVPLWSNLLAAAIVALLVVKAPSAYASLNPLGETRQEFFTFLVLVAVFAAAIEVPGFLMNSRHDDSVAAALADLERAALDAHLDPSGGTNRLQALAESYRSALGDVGLETLVPKAVEHFARMRNIDVTLLGILLRELREARERVVSRSKHPFPQFIEALSLSGMAFLLAEILAILRSR